MHSGTRRRFVDAYLNEVGDLRNSVNRLQLYEIAISAGKDLLLSDLEATDSYQFDEAYAVYDRLPTTNFLEISELYSSNINESQQQQQFIPLKELIETLDEDEELNVEEKKSVLHFLESFANYEGLDYRKLFDEFESTRTRLLDAIANEYSQRQAEMAPVDKQQKSFRSIATYCGVERWQSESSAPKLPSQIRRRAFRIANDDDGRILHYHFVLNQSQIIFIEFELLTQNDQPPERSYKNDLFILLYDTVEEQVVTVTLKNVEDKYISEECLLRAGEYVLSVRALNCLEYVDPAPANDKMLLVGADGKLTKHFKMTLMNMFDLFDLDESGTLSREEFDIYNVVGSDEHVTDQEWDILCRNFQTVNGELLLNSFVALHQLEADNDPTMGDTWMSLLCVGYNERLDLIGNCPCSFTIHSESDVHMRQVELRNSTVDEEEALAGYFWRNGQEVDSDVDVRIWSCDYFAVCVAGPMKLPYAMTVDYSSSENALVKKQTELQRIPLKFIKPKILLQAIATEPEWSLRVTVETTT